MTTTPQKTVAKKAVPARKPPVIAAEPPKPSKVLIHFVEDGATAFGFTWFAGQELEVSTDSPEYQETLDRAGNSWLDLSEEEQSARFGSVRWKSGPSDIPNPIIEFTPWPWERPLMNATSEDQTSLGEVPQALKNLKKRAEAEKARGRGIPTVQA